MNKYYFKVFVYTKQKGYFEKTKKKKQVGKATVERARQ